MPKSNGKLKCFSFSERTIVQINFLCDSLMLNQTSLIEFLINAKYKEELANVKTNETDERNDK